MAAITRVPPDEIVELARAYATTRPAAIRVLIGMEHHERGGATYRAIACLPVLTGAWRDRGGGLLRTMGWAGMFTRLKEYVETGSQVPYFTV